MREVRFDVIGAGNPILDLLAHVPDSFLAEVGGEKGGMVLVDSENIDQWISSLSGPIAHSPGGSAGNTTFALARLGLAATFLGKIGRDEQGNRYKNAFAARGGDISRFKYSDIPNAQCLSLITPDSERTMRTFLGAAASLSPDEISEEDFRGARHAHFEGYLLFNRDLMIKASQCAKAAGCTTSLDLASFEVVNASRDLLPFLLSDYIDLVFANEVEASAFCGDAHSLSKMALELGSLCEIAAVKAGKEGAWICRDQTVIHVPALSGIHAVDTTGAGDLWAAGFLYGYCKDWTTRQSGNLAAALGAAAVQVVGTSIPDQLWEASVRTAQEL